MTAVANEVQTLPSGEYLGTFHWYNIISVRAVSAYLLSKCLTNKHR